MRVIREPKLKVTGPIVTTKEVNSLQPPEYGDPNMWDEIQNFLLTDNRIIVIIDDDATGCQTVHGLSICLDYSEENLIEAFSRKPRALFVMSNSRSLNQNEMVIRIREITKRVQEVSKKLGLEILVISRSDSTLRGHYPIDTDVIKQQLYGTLDQATDVIIPAFFEGGRITVYDSQWVIQDGNCIPVGQTEFAKDPLFGYRYSYLPHYIRDKFSGYAKMPDLKMIEVEELRQKGPSFVKRELLSCSKNSIVIVNALTYKDMEVFVLGALWAEKEGFVPMYRTGASFVRVRAGIPQVPYLSELPKTGPVSSSTSGGLIIVGSSTRLATQQLEELMSSGDFACIELSVPNIIESTAETTELLANIISRHISLGKNVICYTSRNEKRASDLKGQWEIGRKVSSYISLIVASLTVIPKFIVSKGGETAHEVAVHGLHVKTCRVIGQVIPGVPHWEVKLGSKIIPYIVFPGNVGTSTSLRETIDYLLNRKK